MLRIIDRYLMRQVGASFGAVTIVLLLVSLGGTLTITLDRIARGKMPASLLLSQIALRSLEGMTLLLPLAAYLAVLLAYGRLYRDSEMAVLSASGVTTRGLLAPVFWVGGVLAAVVAVLALWAAPAAMTLSDRMIDAANRSLLVVGMEPGRFVELPGRDGVVYVAEMSADGASFSRLFVYDEREQRVDITTAERGELFQDRDGAERYLSLREGFRVEGELGKPNFRTIRFARNDIRLPEAERDPDRALERRRSLAELAASTERKDHAELHWRLAMPISALVLAILALPLSRVQPREPRYGRLLVAVLAYIIYSNLLSLGRAWIGDGTLATGLGLWWVHALVLVVAIAMMVRQERFNLRQAR
jgi:lipopolysaccharide export system permease protein